MIAIYGDTSTYTIVSEPIAPPDEPNEFPTEDMWIVRYPGPPPKRLKHVQRIHYQPLIKRRNHHNIARRGFIHRNTRPLRA